MEEKTLKKVLIVTYYWPPAGGPGVQRWLKFVKYLPDFGYFPVVYCPENPSYPILDQTLAQELNDSKYELVKHPIWEPYKWASLLSKKTKDFQKGQFKSETKPSFVQKALIFIRGNLFIPDARKFWIQPSVHFLEKYIQHNDIQTVITTGPPHSVHFIGLNLKKKLGIEFIADFRDPWTSISYHSELRLTNWAKKRHEKLEKKVLKSVDTIIATSKTDQKNFEKLGAKKAITITNGFDGEIEVSQKERNEKFTISYIGGLEKLRNPQNLWMAINELIQEEKIQKSQVKVKLVGNISKSILVELDEIFQQYGILELLGYVSADEAQKQVLQSDLLLITNFNSEKSKGIIPAKIFEYLKSGNAILSVGTKESEVENILNKTSAGKHFEYPEKKAIKEFILENYTNWITGSPNESFCQEAIEGFHRKKLTQKLVEVL